MQGNEKGPSVKRMAELLKSGAAMLSENCPDCKVPLFRLKGEVYCPNCGRKVLLVKSDEELAGATVSITLAGLEETVLRQITELERRVKAESDTKGLDTLGNLLSMWLDILGKIRVLRREPDRVGERSPSSSRG